MKSYGNRSFCPPNFVRFFFTLFSLTRFFISLGLVDRPITMAFIFAMVANWWKISIGTGIFFELLWLDYLAVGTFIPPQRQLPLFLVLSVSYSMNLPGKLFYILILLSLPFAHIGALIEKYHRIMQNKSYDEVTKKISLKKTYPLNKKIIKSLIQLVVLNMTGFYLGYVAIFSIIYFIEKNISFPHNPINWPLLWGISFVGGILALRIKDSYLILLGTYIIFGIILLR